MNKYNLFWIIPVITLITGFLWGASVSWNIVAEKCNQQVELSYQLNEIECKMSDLSYNMWEYYEKRCPNVYNEVISGNLNFDDEFKKYGINNSKEE
jgi:uncharacterized membrane-anchored protein YhcB (DUF1043 family)